MQAVAKFLQAHFDAVFASCILLFVLGAWAWHRSDLWVWEIAIFMLSMAAMPLIYVSMFAWDGGFAIFSAPQISVLLVLAVFAAWGLMRKNAMVVVPLGLSFLVNLFGYWWAKVIL